MSAGPYLGSCRMGSDEKHRPPQLCGEYIWIALTNSFERRSDPRLGGSRLPAGKNANAAGPGRPTHGRPEWAIGTSAKPTSHWWFKTQSITIGEMTPKNGRLRVRRSFRNLPANRGR